MRHTMNTIEIWMTLDSTDRAVFERSVVFTNEVKRLEAETKGVGASYPHNGTSVEKELWLEWAANVIKQRVDVAEIEVQPIKSVKYVHDPIALKIFKSLRLYDLRSVADDLGVDVRHLTREALVDACCLKMTGTLASKIKSK